MNSRNVVEFLQSRDKSYFSCGFAVDILIASFVDLLIPLTCSSFCEAFHFMSCYTSHSFCKIGLSCPHQIKTLWYGSRLCLFNVAHLTCCCLAGIFICNKNVLRFRSIIDPCQSGGKSGTIDKSNFSIKWFTYRLHIAFWFIWIVNW